jgi:uncharacterized protein
MLPMHRTKGRPRRSLLLAATLASAACAPAAPNTQAPAAANTAAAATAVPIDWQPFAPETFARAKQQNRLILLTLVTTWCHYCHVMDKRTWADPAVSALVSERFIAIRVDADSRPDLAERYAAWGWPATALLSPDAEAITHWKGSQNPRKFETALASYVADLDAGRPFAPPVLALAEGPPPPLAVVRDRVQAQLDRYWDDEQGGWGAPQKYPRWGPITAGLLRSTGFDQRKGDEVARARVTKTLLGTLQLIDAVDGGVFQYSLQGVWDRPHYEKLAVVNGTVLENLTDAWLMTGDERFLQGANDIRRYLQGHLQRTDGGYFANQDADVGTRGEHPFLLGDVYYTLPREQRAQKGAPFIDRHVYAAHNGRVLAGIVRLAVATGDQALLGDARRTADVLLKNHQLESGAFVHAEDEKTDDMNSPPLVHLLDQVAVGRALLLLFEATGEEQWLAAAKRTATFLQAELSDTDGAFFAHTVDPTTPTAGVFAARRKPLHQNAEAARFLRLLGSMTGDDALIAAAGQTLQAVATPKAIKAEGWAVGELLTALHEQLQEPLRFAIVARTEAEAAPWRAAILATWAPHRVVEVTPPGKKYPDLGEPAVFVCGLSFCSPPITTTAKLKAEVARAQP